MNVTADQQVALGGQWKLNAGGALSWAGSHDWQRYLPREGSIEAVDTESSLDEYTANLYAGASRTLSKGSLSFSLAGEYYRMGDYENWALYPQASFNWMFSEEHMLQLTLSSDKSYPSYWEMQGAVSYVDGYSEIHGSPGLRPAKNYSAQALYMLRSKYIFMLFWNETLDYFTQSAWQSSERLALIYQTLNWDTNRQWGANVIIPFKAGRWLESRLVFTGLQLTALRPLPRHRLRPLEVGRHRADGQHLPPEPQARPDARPLGPLPERRHPGDLRRGARLAD